MRTSIIFLLCLLIVTSCSPASSDTKSSTISIDGDAMKVHIEKLSSDEMEGRAPGGKGEELATT
jgi:hypothetical protein